MLTRVLVITGIVVVLAAPFVFRGETAAPVTDARRLIVITPHNEQIRFEFGRAFAEWHERRYDEAAVVVFNVPGGTSEIRKMLEAQFTASVLQGETLGGQADIVFGGGSYEHTSLKRGVRVTVGDTVREVPITAPATFDQAWLDETYGENRIGNTSLYDPDQYWFGTALSGFGIVYNRDALATIGLDAPQTWADLCAPELDGWVAMVNPGQSGSITTAFEAILLRLGWEEGWRILRRAAANARYFSASSLRPPTDVSEGDAAVGICIDFYGRFQSQALAVAGYDRRLGYVDPVGATTIDPDPVSMLAGAPDAELAQRFIEFCLSDDAQALWQFRQDDPVDDGLGPDRYELRRLMIRRSMYDQYPDRAIDDVNPYEIASAIDAPDRNVRRFIATLFSAMAMETHDELRRAWRAIIEHPAFPRDEPLVRAEAITDSTLRRMIEQFDSMPEVEGPNDTAYSMATTEHLATIRAGWLKREWQDDGLWPVDAAPAAEMRRRFGAFFRSQYRSVHEAP